jgi:hypothetical protein
MIEPLPTELAELVAKERVPAPGADVEARLLSRLDASVERAVASAASPPRAASPPSHALKAWAVKSGLVAIGFSAGVVAHATLWSAPAVAPPVMIRPPAPSEERVAEPAPAPPPPSAPPLAPALKPARASAPTAPRPEPTAVGTLEEERRLLEPARAALARGLSSEALAAVTAHAQRFPHGELSEDREALWIQALVQSGDRDAAAARAEAFKRDYAGSLLWPVVEKALGSPKP